MSLLLEIFVTLVIVLVGAAIRRYFILTSGEKKTGLPFIKGFDFFTGSKEIIFTNNKVLAVNAHDRHLELGDTFGCYFGQNMQVVSRDPDLIYKICVTDFQKHRNRYHINSLSPYMMASLLEARDNHWQTSRRAVGSVLKASKLKMDNVDTDIDVTIGRMLKAIDRRLEEMQTSGKECDFNIYQVNKNFFMQSILKIIYDTENMVDFDNEYNEVVEELYKFINVNYEAIARYCFLIPVLTDLVRPILGYFDHGKFLGKLTGKLEKILGKTLKAQQLEGRRLTTIHSLINSYRKGELTKNQLMGNSVFLMVAGFATSVDTMSALMWELAKNPEVQEKLRADLKQYGEGSKYLEQCVNETLRLYPGAITNRELSEHLEHKGFRLVRGQTLQVSIYSLHRNPHWWGPDAEKWRPERFEPGEVAKFHPAQFIPFGIGPRNCVGYNLAKLELSKFTVQFILKYKLECSSKTRSKLNFAALGALPFALPIESPIHLKLSLAESAAH